jgi:hypothetical protein
MDVKTPVTTPIRPGIPPRKKYAATILTTRKAKAMGSPVSNSKTIPPKNRERLIHHSISYFPVLILKSAMLYSLKNPCPS